MSGGIRIGLDVGGTKIEALAIDAQGRELARRRIASAAHDYGSLLVAIVGLVEAMERELGNVAARVGMGMPGALSPHGGVMKNANSTVLNGRPFVTDLSNALGRELRAENDANCFALSEATDGAGAGHAVVFGVILGTGVGGGLVVNGRLLHGANAIGGEWGHNELPSRVDPDLPDTACYCGRRRCIETYVSGPALAADHVRQVPEAKGMAAVEVAALAARGDPSATATLDRFHERLAGALASVVNVVDPDVIVLGGGLSLLPGIAGAVSARLGAHVFSDRCTTPVRSAAHGDSSGVRGAAWLWPA